MFECTIPRRDWNCLKDCIFSPSFPLPGTGKREGGEKTQPFNRFHPISLDFCYAMTGVKVRPLMWAYEGSGTHMGMTLAHAGTPPPSAASANPLISISIARHVPSFLPCSFQGLARLVPPSSTPLHALHVYENERLSSR